MAGRVADPGRDAAPARDPFTTCAWLAVASLACLLVVLRLVQQGMFLDGLMYADIARNMAEGAGSVWAPKFSETLFPVFAEHPPLQFWFEAALFWGLGDGLYVEKIYSLLTALAAGLLVMRFWSALAAGQRQSRKLGWLPLLFLLAIPSVPWAFANNLLEGTLFVFTTLAVYLVYRGCGGTVFTGRRLAFVAAAGLATSAAVLAKGPVGLFPIAAPAIHWLTLRRTGFWIAAADTVVLTGVVAAVFAVLLAWPEPRGYAERYLDAQLLPSLSGARGHAGGGLAALWSLAGAVAIPFAACMALTGIARFRRDGLAGPPAVQMREAAFMLLVALSASIPILLSPRVHSFYFVPSMPFYALGFALLCAPALVQLCALIPEPIAGRLPVLATVALLAAATAVAFRVGKIGRDADVIHDVKLVGERLCDGRRDCGKLLAVCPQAWKHWSLHAYFQRYYRISLTDSEKAAPQILVHADCGSVTLPGYQDQEIGLGAYRLLAKAPAG